MGKIFAKLEVTIRCLKCGDVIAVNACVNEVYCPSCSGKANIQNKSWSLLLNEIFNEVKGMHFGEAGRTLLDDDKTGTIRVSLRRINFDPQKNGSSLLSRTIPETLSSKMKGVFFDEDSHQIAEAKQQSKIDQTIKIECASCGGTIETEGKKRNVICSYCSSNNLLSDEIWHRLHPAENIRPWIVSYITDESVKLKPWVYGNIRNVCCDDKILYCVGESKNDEYAVWAMSEKGELIWMSLIPKDKRWKDDYFSNVILLADGRLLIWNEFVHCALTFNSSTGDFTGELGGLEPFNAKMHHFDLYFCISLAADPGGSMVGLINQRILRYSKDGIGIPTWPKRGLGGRNLKSLYKKRNKDSKEISVYNKREGKYILAGKLKNYSKIYPTYGSSGCTAEVDSESSVYIIVPRQTNVKRQITGGAILTKFNKNGEIVYKADLEIFCTEKIYTRIDHKGYAYVLMTDAKDEFENSGRIMRISPDGKETKIIVKANYQLLNPSDYFFTVSNEGNIHIVGDGGVLRTYDREGEQLWRSESAIQKDKDIFNNQY